MSTWGNQIRGGPQLGQVKRDYEGYREQLAEKQIQIAIARFQLPPDTSGFTLSQYEAAGVSMRQKVKTFGYLNAPVTEHILSTR